MEADLPSVAFSIHGSATSRVEAVIKDLELLGFPCAKASDIISSSGCAVLFFSAVSNELLEDVARFKTTQTLCLCVALTIIPSSYLWRLIRAGASDVIADSLHIVGQIAARMKRWHSTDLLLKSKRVANYLVGTSFAWTRFLRQVVEVAAYTFAPVLIVGETGTGKDLLSRLIHSLDPRAERVDLVTVDCTTIVPELSGSELFGHERGAFTGALTAREGAFSLANKGTLFLDEVGELPLSLQAQFLRAIQERTYKKVGGNIWHQTDFRLVCATNRDLEEEVQKGNFRADLYYRLASWIFRPPPLRDRREDILPLARHFLASALPSEAEVEFDPVVAEHLMSRQYSGNVRELRQLVTRIGERHVGPGLITAGDLPADEWPAFDQGASATWPDAAFEESIRRGLAHGAELRTIGQAASETAIRLTVQSEQGNLQRAAKRLGITDRALQLRRASGQL